MNMKHKADAAYWYLDDRGFHLNHPLRYRPWYNYLSNGDYGLKLSHLGDGYSSTLNEPRVVVTNYDFFTPNRGRFLYVKSRPSGANSGQNNASGYGGDGKPAGPEPISANRTQPETETKTGTADCSVWNPGFYPSANHLDSYSCTHAPGYTEITGSRDGIEVSSLHLLPEEGSYELWKVRVKNLSAGKRCCSIYSLAEFLLYDNMGVDPVYFSWFTNSRYVEDKHRLEFFRTDQKPVFGFFSSSRKPRAFEAGLGEFLREGDYRDPQAIRSGQLGNNPSAGDPYAGIFQFDLDLEPGQVEEWVMIIGQGEAAAEESARLYPGGGEVDELLSRTLNRWSAKLDRPEWAKPADATLSAYLRTFFPYQIIQQANGMVRSSFRGFRDVAQDAMGLAFFDIDGSAELIRSLCTKMMDDGRCLRQWNTGGGRNDERDFRDLPLWLPLAVDRYLDQGGDAALLGEELEFFGGREKVSVWEHMLRGMEYVLKYGPHDLLEIGAGDWNDALSGLGLRGESLWLNEMAYLALEKLDRMAGRFNLDMRINTAAHRDRLYNGVMRGWTGKWFLRGYHESGTPIGSQERIFLLPQAWFTISGMARRAPEKGRIALESMVERLSNDNGLLICHPGFTSFDPTVGNLSCLAPGVAENFAVYNHASAFGIYALFEADMKDQALEYMNRLLPFNKDPDKTMAEPYVLVNYYNGGYYSSKDGRGGVPWLTGTVHWLAFILFDQVFPSGIEI